MRLNLARKGYEVIDNFSIGFSEYLNTNIPVSSLTNCFGSEFIRAGKIRESLYNKVSQISILWEINKESKYVIIYLLVRETMSIS